MVTKNQSKASGNVFHLGVLVKLCGKLRVIPIDLLDAAPLAIVHLSNRKILASGLVRPK
jgi:hypothetical protein